MELISFICFLFLCLLCCQNRAQYGREMSLSSTYFPGNYFTSKGNISTFKCESPLGVLNAQKAV